MVIPSPTQDRQPMSLPAVCGTCGTIFPSGFAIAGGPHYFSNTLAGPCPGCGGMGRVPDGVFDSNRPDLIAVLKAMADLGSIHNLERMVGLLAAASKDDLLAIRQALAIDTPGRSADQVAQDIQRAAPDLPGAAALIRNRDNRLELATWLTLLVTIISLLIAVKASHQEITPQRQEQIIRVIVPAPRENPTTPRQLEGRRPGRNERCPCGSDLKFKHCHDSATARP
jgi:hypothetical protein